MFKKRIWKYILISFCWLASLGGLVVLMSFIDVKKAGVLCTDVKVYIPGNQYFIDKDEIDNILQIKRHALIGHALEGINIRALEDKLKANPFIETAKVYTDMDGVIWVEITQRQPILRILNQDDKDFYVDQHGFKVPLSANFTAQVLAANGFIDEPFSGRVDTLHTEIAREVFATADYIRKDSLWDAQIAQIYVNKDHEIELIPRVGNQRILLGNADSLDVKFHNLLAFYKKALPQMGWDTYKTINIKYANQVIGVKNVMTKQDSINAKNGVKDSIKATIDSAITTKDTSQIKN
ncbi:cell division protein FtsQ [Mucilaginibacter mallensis]|uniref:Cell division protein FtsQ n=1 Tax=Mucilaginibacter mallensis TaxID=652787 RepID=A0A1H1P9U1_MUCMA|nr:cell division protein FtsQ [Mucilaginibacter mallensis]SDS08056.1 cell division protein FtsQ [Mucilaginibacter mallensis]